MSFIKTPGKSCPRYRKILEDIRGDFEEGVLEDEAEVIEHTMLPAAEFEKLYNHLQERTGGLFKNSYHLLDQVEELDLEQWGLPRRQPGIYIDKGVVLIAMKVWDGSESDKATEPGAFWVMVYVSTNRVEQLIHDTMVSFNPA